MQSHSAYSEDSYKNIFPPDQYNDENIEFISHQNDHNDDNLNDVLVVQEKDRQIGIKLMLPVLGNQKEGMLSQQNVHLSCT